jgi:hypothetical protein
VSFYRHDLYVYFMRAVTSTDAYPTRYLLLATR